MNSGCRPFNWPTAVGLYRARALSWIRDDASRQPRKGRNRSAGSGMSRVDYDSDRVDVWWDGIIDPGELNGGSPARKLIADTAFSANWAKLFSVLDSMQTYEPYANVNSTRLGGASLFTPLHQAAWALDRSAIDGLVARGAWRTVRDSRGRRAVDIARERGATADLVEALEPEPLVQVDPEILRGLQLNVDFAFRGELHWRDKPLRLPEVEVLTEIDGATMWFGVPMQYGGIRLTFDGDAVILESSSRMDYGATIYRVEPDCVRITRTSD